MRSLRTPLLRICPQEMAYPSVGCRFATGPYGTTFQLIINSFSSGKTSRQATALAYQNGWLAPILQGRLSVAILPDSRM